MIWRSGGPSRTSTTAHRRWRRAVLTRDPICVVTGCDQRAIRADHVVPVAEGGDQYDLANGQGMCAPHHDAKTQREAARGRARADARARHPERRHPGLLEHLAPWGPTPLLPLLAATVGIGARILYGSGRSVAGTREGAAL